MKHDLHYYQTQYLNNSEGMFSMFLFAHGRIRRTEYIISFIGYIGLVLLIYNLFEKDGNQKSANGLSSLIIIVLTIYFYLQKIKRFHDIGWSGWWCLCPVVTWICPLFWPGDDGINDYGSNPRRDYAEQIEEMEAQEEAYQQMYSVSATEENGERKQEPLRQTIEPIVQQPMERPEKKSHFKTWVICAGVFAFIIVATAIIMKILSPKPLTPEQQELQNIIISTNNRCPESFGYGLTMRQAAFTNDTVNIRYSANEELFRLISKQNGKHNILLMFLSSVNGAGEAASYAKSNAPINLEFTCKGVKQVFAIESQELKDFLHEKDWTVDETQLELSALLANDKCPQEIDEITKITKIQLTDSAYIYEYEVDSKEIDPASFSSPKIAKEERKNVMKHIKDNSETNYGFYAVLLRTSRSVIYRYTHKQSGKTMEIIIKNNELNDIIYPI